MPGMRTVYTTPNGRADVVTYAGLFAVRTRQDDGTWKVGPDRFSATYKARDWADKLSMAAAGTPLPEVGDWVALTSLGTMRVLDGRRGDMHVVVGIVDARQSHDLTERTLDGYGVLIRRDDGGVWQLGDGDYVLFDPREEAAR